MLLTRQSPLVPFTVLNLAYGLSGVRLSTFVLGLIGIFPGTLSTGQPVGMDPWLRLLRMETGPGAGLIQSLSMGSAWAGAAPSPGAS